MYIYPTQTYYRGTEQCTQRGWFLMLMQPDLGGWDGLTRGGKLPVRAILRKVALQQCGHRMMGTAHAANKRLTVSGSYGNDGLTMSVSPEVYALGVELPQELYDKWAQGGGWNSAGSEAPAMREWARAHYAELAPQGRQ